MGGEPGRALGARGPHFGRGRPLPRSGWARPIPVPRFPSPSPGRISVPPQPRNAGRFQGPRPRVREHRAPDRERRAPFRGGQRGAEGAPVSHPLAGALRGVLCAIHLSACREVEIAFGRGVLSPHRCRSTPFLPRKRPLTTPLQEPPLPSTGASFPPPRQERPFSPHRSALPTPGAPCAQQTGRWAGVHYLCARCGR
ncbi:WAS/WASL-interacting protein family member 1-like [Homo sapiens]|uniref:WAS/WASL-interacting protein family member 1-like n=1 Tax=Homo sapiens TaxID=9606 RepID=UPI001FB0824E|nr:WAS/WASL-interacting protein family member 1-like [Homo sapiens]